MVKVVMVEADAPRRTGFLKVQFTLPEDFDDMAADHLQAMFERSAE